MINVTNKSVLWFSGGKDSLACLYLMREHWGSFKVLHVDTGAKLPEVDEFIHRLAASVPEFHIVKSDQSSWVQSHGLPVDVLPVMHSGFGHYMRKGNDLKLQPFVTCCENNLWKPMSQVTKAMGAKTVFHGTRKADAIGNQHIIDSMVDGIRYISPIADWSDEDVNQFLSSCGEPIPEWYSVVKHDTSMDCWNCTAFMREADGRIGWLRDRHPEKHKAFMFSVNTIRSAIKSESEVYERV